MVVSSVKSFTKALKAIPAVWLAIRGTFSERPLNDPIIAMWWTVVRPSPSVVYQYGPGGWVWPLLSWRSSGFRGSGDFRGSRTDHRERDLRFLNSFLSGSYWLERYYGVNYPKHVARTVLG